MTWNQFKQIITNLSKRQESIIVDAYKTRKAVVLGSALIDITTNEIMKDVEPIVDAKIASGNLTVADVEKIVGKAGK
jgi:hypothetical protein